MNRLKNLIFKIGGNENVFTLEHRIFNISCFMITLFTIIGCLGNYLSNLHMMTVWLSIAGILISAFQFYFARIRGFFSIKVMVTYLAATVFILGLMFFFNGGTQGAVLYLIIMFLNIFLLTVPSVYLYFFALVIFVTVILLIILEFLFPKWIIPYHSRSEMLLDHGVVMFYTVFFTTIILVIFRRNYIKDRQKILTQNESLLLLNQQIGFQKDELEIKAKQLEYAIENANVRTLYIETLLKELNHRVKNNLQLVSSLLQKQANLSTDNAAKAALLDTKNRLLSLILLHQRLYVNENITTIPMLQYLKQLAESIAISFSNFGEENISYDIDDIWLNVEPAISIGLIANELITNSFKHAFIGIPEPTLHISFKEAEHEYILSIADNGIGIKENIKDSTFGLQLIHLLTKQLRGRYLKSKENNIGSSFSITFNKNEIVDIYEVKNA